MVLGVSSADHSAGVLFRGGFRSRPGLVFSARTNDHEQGSTRKVQQETTITSFETRNALPCTNDQEQSWSCQVMGTKMVM